VRADRWRTRRQASVRLVVAGIVLLSVYESVGAIISAIGAPLRDRWVVAVERRLFPSMPPLAPTNLPPAVVDAFSIAYAAYFALPVILLAVLVRRGRLDDARAAMRTLLAAYYAHYAIYIVVPVVGPIRAADVPAEVRAQLAGEGGAVTHRVRQAVDFLERTPQDAFPSAHTSIAIIVAALARRYRLRGQTIFTIAAAVIACSTVVLGYHYLVDLAAAVPLVCAAIRVGIPRPAAFSRVAPCSLPT
jgi:membrane-associated phospholipid phosphatase